jgi:hypothetical protein
MLIIASVIAVIVFICIFLFFRLENIKQSLQIAKGEINSTKRENKQLVDSLVLVAKRYEEFAQYRLAYYEELSSRYQNEENQLGLFIITPLIQYYGHIFQECLKKDGRLAIVVKACYDKKKAPSFDEFTLFISKQDTAVKKMWQQNNLLGYVSLVEALLIKQGKLFDQWHLKQMDQHRSKNNTKSELLMDD